MDPMPLNQRKAINNVRIRMIFLFLNNLEDCRRHSPGIGIAAHLHQCAVMFLALRPIIATPQN